MGKAAATALKEHGFCSLRALNLGIADLLDALQTFKRQASDARHGADLLRQFSLRLQ
jgi:hypothetical protein